MHGLITVPICSLSCPVAANWSGTFTVISRLYFIFTFSVFLFLFVTCVFTGPHVHTCSSVYGTIGSAIAEGPRETLCRLTSLAECAVAPALC